MSSQPPLSGPASAGGFDHVRPDDELLVAYLDGELDQRGVSSVEAQLAGDALMRRRLHDLRAAWDLLEELPSTELSPRFAQSTIEMVAMSASTIEETSSQSRLRRRIVIASLATLPVLFMLGYIAARWGQRSAERKAIEGVHVLADWDSLKKVGSYEWLQKIRKVENLDRVVKRPTSGLGIGIVPTEFTQRKAWIEQLSSTDRDRLSANLEDFKHTTPPERQRILDLAEQIYQGADPLGDLQAARDYAHFLNDLSINDRIAHSDQREEALRLEDLTRRVNRKMVLVYTQELAPDAADRKAVQAWIRSMESHYGNLLPRRNRGGSSVLSDLNRRLIGDGDSVIDDDDLDVLLQSLTPAAQDIISRLRTTEAQHNALILYFVSEAQPNFTGPGPRQNVDRAQLTKRFEALGDSQQGVIEFLPPEKAQSRLGLQSDAPARPDNRQDNGRGRTGFNPSAGPAGSRDQLRDERIEQSENKIK